MILGIWYFNNLFHFYQLWEPVGLGSRSDQARSSWSAVILVPTESIEHPPLRIPNLHKVKCKWFRLVQMTPKTGFRLSTAEDDKLSPILTKLPLG